MNVNVNVYSFLSALFDFYLTGCVFMHFYRTRSALLPKRVTHIDTQLHVSGPDANILKWVNCEVSMYVCVFVWCKYVRAHVYMCVCA